VNVAAQVAGSTTIGVPATEITTLAHGWSAKKQILSKPVYYVVQEIMAAHEGTIAVRSTPGTGTTFIMTLPSAVTASG
jgi:sensor histidine kinase regulating citrate/malate metabolism